MAKKDSKGVLRATHAGEIKIGEITLPCAVLEDGTRVISERAVSMGFGLKRSGSSWKNKTEVGARLPVFAAANNISPFIGKELRLALVSPLVYKPLTSRLAHGLRAELLPLVCEIWLKARDAGVLHKQQVHVAVAADMLIRGLARVGIIALVDEATGYQEDRKKDELSKILEAYINEELRPWVAMFPNELFRQIYRLNDWPFDPESSSRNQQLGHWINKHIYSVLPPGVLEELQRKNPRRENGHRDRKSVV